MFGGNDKIFRLQKELDALRDYCIKFTQDVNTFAGTQNQTIAMLQSRLDKLEGEKQDV